MTDATVTAPFFPIVADYDRKFFSVEGPMTDDHPWHAAARCARDQQRHVVCGPRGMDRDALAVEFRETENMAGVPPGSIVRPNR
jgi:hypothetical protein